MAVSVSTGKYGSPSGFLLVDGYNLTAMKVKELKHKIGSVLEETTGIGDTWREKTPTGVREAEFSQGQGFFDTATGASHDALEDGLPANPQSAVRILCFGYAGNVIGAPMVGAEGAYQQSYEVLAQVAQLTKASAEYGITGQIDDNAAILHELSAESTGDDTEDESVDNTSFPQRTIPITSSSVASPSVITCPVPHGLTTGDTVLITGHSGSTPDINGEEAVTVVDTLTFTVVQNVTVGGTGGTFTVGETNDGGIAYLQVTALTLGGYDDAVITVRDSADDMTFGDLVAFTAVTAIGAERVTVAGEVLRYLAQDIAFSGSGSGESCTYLVGFKRN